MSKLKSIISSPILPYLFYSLWFILALIQANFTELLSDEAYYWKYSQFLDWGYFDHPPMVALLIKMGTALFSGELGVRFLFTILGTATIFLIEKIVNPQNKGLFYAIISSIGLLYFTSVLALADVPLLFFTALFFYLLKRYLNYPSIKLAILLGFTIAGLLLSKYHGFVIILMALLTNLKLLKQPQFYVIILTALALVIPHFLWQLNHDFPSIQYHFNDRNLNAYSIYDTINFLLVQLVLFGPFIGLFLWIGFIKSSAQNQFEKVLYWQVIGIIVFFFLLTFNGKVQGHWTSILIIPLIYFGYQFLIKNQPFKKWTYYQLPVALFIILTVKLGLIANLPFGNAINALFDDFKGHKTWAKAIQKETGTLPVVFMNSYQNASKYEFYSGERAITISNVMSRKNQFDLWQYEDTLRGKTVALIPNYEVKRFKSIPNIKPPTQFGMIDNFQYYSQVELKPLNWKESNSQKDSLLVILKMENAAPFTFQENSVYPSFISYAFFKDNEYVSQHKTKLNCAKIEKANFELKMKLPEAKGTYQVYFCIKTGSFPAGLNSRVYLLDVD